MKKHTLILLVSAVMLSCNFGEKAKAVVESIENSSKKETNASDIIEFNNKYIATDERRRDWLKNWDNYTQRVYAYIHSENENEMRPISLTYIEIATKVAKEVPSAFGDDQKEMQENLDLQAESFKAVRDIESEIKKYVSSEDYKDDGGKKFETLMEEADNHIINYYEAQDFIYEKLQAKADEAEEIVLKDHPMRKEILGSKSLLASIDELMIAIDEQYAEATFEDEEIQKWHDETEKKLKANQKFKVNENRVQKGKQKSLEAYNNAVDDYLGSVRKLLRNARDNGSIDDSSYNDADRKYKQTIRTYNTFVD